MTKEDFLKLSDYERDVAVAIQIMELAPTTEELKKIPFFNYPDLPKYSSNMQDALQVVSKLEAQGWGYEPHGNPNTRRACRFTRQTTMDLKQVRAEADSLPLAICLAAFDALGLLEPKAGVR